MRGNVRKSTLIKERRASVKGGLGFGLYLGSIKFTLRERGGGGREGGEEGTGL